MLKNKIAFIGLGQAGGNITALAEREGYVNGVINTSPEDLNNSTLKYIRNKLLIGYDGGAGKDRNVAKNNIKNYYKDIINFFNEKIFAINKNIEVVFLCFSLGGGTGSGFGPILTDTLKSLFPKITFFPIVILPYMNESTLALYNTRKCLEELYTLNVPLMIVDNETYDEGSRKANYDYINRAVLNRIRDFSMNRTNVSVSNMDIMDKMKLLKTPGVTVITRSRIRNADIQSQDDFINAIQASYDDNVFAGIEYDKKINRIGYIFDIKESFTKYIDYKQLHKDIGTPLEIFEGIYNNNTDYSEVITILTGLSYPEGTISKIDSTIKEMEEQKSVLEQKTSLLNTGNKTSLFGGVKEEVKENKFDTVDLEALFGKY